MINALSFLETGDQVVTWLVIAFLVIYFVYKEWPDFKRRITTGTKKEAASEAQSKEVADRLSAIERRLASLDGKMQRDYDRLNRLEQELNKRHHADQDSLEEREIIMRSLLGIIEGLQEIGANGPTKAAQAEINEYLNRKAHKANAD